MKKLHLFYGIAVFVFILGLIVTVRAMQSTPHMSARIHRKLGDMAELRALADTNQDIMASLELFNRLDLHTPRSLAEIADGTTDRRPTLRRRDSKPAAGGWNVVTMTATFEDIPLASLSAFIRRASETGRRPPWQLVECTITALDRGRGRAVLVLEALEKPQTGT